MTKLVLFQEAKIENILIYFYINNLKEKKKKHDRLNIEKAYT